MQALPGAPIGGVVPVDVSIANGTDEPYLVQPDQVFAINEQGQRIMPVPASEAIQEAGNANALKAGLTGAAKNAAIRRGCGSGHGRGYRRRSRYDSALAGAGRVWSALP